MNKSAGYFQHYDSGDWGNLIRGCDISSYQLPVNFSTMYSAGARFCYIKAGGNLVDSIDTVRYVKVTVNGNDEDNVAQFNELQVYDTSIVDRASGVTPTASSAPTSGALANVTDGDDGTYARFTTGEQWIKVDLSTTYNIRYIRLKQKSTVTYNNLKIEVSSNDSDYTTVYDSTQSGTGEFADTTSGAMIIGATHTFSQNGACDSTVIANARAAGLPVGFYWFHNPNYYDTSTLSWRNTTADAEAEAVLFKTYIDNELGGNDYGDIMPMLDWENNYGSIYPSTDNDGAWEFINAFVNKFRELTGRQIILYSAYYTNETLSTTGNQLVHSVYGGIGTKCPLWLSAMYGAGTYPSYNYTAFGDFYNEYWRIWQYSTDGNGQGSTYGVSTSDVDLNFVESLEYITDVAEFPYFTYRTRGNETEGTWDFSGDLQKDSVDVVTDDRTINGYDLTANVTLDSDDIGEGSSNLYLTGNEFQKTSDTMDDITNGSTYVKTTNDYSNSEKTKLSGITTGADLVSSDDETVSGSWTFSSGIINKNVVVATVGNEVKYLRLCRLKFPEDYGRAYARINIIHTGTNLRIGTLAIMGYEAAVGTIHASSEFNAINDLGFTSKSFSAGDVQYQQWSTAGNTTDFIDIWVEMSNYSTVSFSIDALHYEVSSTIEFDPDGGTTQASIPVATSTDTYDGENVTAQDSGTNFTIKTVTMT